MKHPFTVTEREMRNRYYKHSLKPGPMDFPSELYIASKATGKITMTRQDLLKLEAALAEADPTTFDRVMALRAQAEKRCGWRCLPCGIAGYGDRPKNCWWCGEKTERLESLYA